MFLSWLWGASAIIFLLELFYFLRRREMPKNIWRRVAASLFLPLGVTVFFVAESYWGRHSDLPPLQNAALTLILLPLLLGPVLLVSFLPFLFRGVTFKTISFQGLLLGFLFFDIWLK